MIRGRRDRVRESLVFSTRNGAWYRRSAVLRRGQRRTDAIVVAPASRSHSMRTRRSRRRRRMTAAHQRRAGAGALVAAMGGSCQGHWSRRTPTQLCTRSISTPAHASKKCQLWTFQLVEPTTGTFDPEVGQRMQIQHTIKLCPRISWRMCNQSRIWQ